MSHRDRISDGLPSECRVFRASPEAATDAPHARACASCAAALALRARLGDALRRPPMPPAALASRAFLTGVHERIVDGIEAASSLAPRLAEPVAAPSADLTASLDDRLARALATPPALPDEGRWSDVRRAVIHDIAVRRASRTRIAVWLGLAGAAAAALLVLVGPQTSRTNAPEIVFADLDTAPFGDFAIVRRGADR